MQTLRQMLQTCTQREKSYMEYLYNTLPKSDTLTYPPPLILAFVQHSLKLRGEVPWCAALPENIFCEYVLYPRVNDEDLSEHRELFYESLYPRIAALPLEEAVLEANRWAHEHVTYELQDLRTASPRTVFASGTGRCGEQSGFVVAALRSVGIPARQVYAPRWSHCDDNHAWVEVWVNGEWRFFGACEPEPVLDRGWFNLPAARAMLVHVRSFAGGDDTGEAYARMDGITLYNDTARYAKTKQYTFSVAKGGAPVAGVALLVCVPNEAQLIPLCTLYTGKDGLATAKFGCGDLYVEARHGGLAAVALVPGSEESVCGCGMELDTPETAAVQRSYTFKAPVPPVQAMPALGDKQRTARETALAHGNAKRQARIQAMLDLRRAAALPELAGILRDARGNFETVHTFLTQGPDKPLRSRMVQALRSKDLRDIPLYVLEAHLHAAAPYAGEYPEKVFDEGVLCPHIAFERITPWRQGLLVQLVHGQAEFFHREPKAVWEYVQEKVTVSEALGHRNLYLAPDIALQTRRCSERDRRVLCVALMRSAGVPARLAKLDGTPEYWQAGAWHRVEQPLNATLTLAYKGQEPPVYHLHWGLARRTGEGWQSLDLGDRVWKNGTLQVALPAGEYRLLSTNRMPNGNQLVEEQYCTLAVGQAAEANVELRQYSLEEMLMRQPLPAFVAATMDGKQWNTTSLAGKPSLLFWLEEGAEPTEHVVNELLEEKQRLQALDIPVVLLLRSKAAAGQQTVAKLLAAWPELAVVLPDWHYTLETVARSLYCDPSVPPLAVVCNGEGEAVYATNGYRVGAVNLLYRIAAFVQ